jgi:hypothetical protein
MSREKRVKRRADEILRAKGLRMAKEGNMTPSLAKASGFDKAFIKTGKRENKTWAAIKNRLKSMND